MKHQWLAYVVVGLLSIGAGVAIAGFPNNVPVDATIVPPTTEAIETNVTDPPDTTTSQVTTEPETTPPATTEPAATSPTDPSTSTPATSTPDTTDVAAELPDRSEFEVAVANGANVAGAAAQVASRLEAQGYVDVLPLNGSEIVEFTIVFYADGLEDAALRLAEDLDLLPEFIAPIDEMPNVADLPNTIELVAYVGRDRA